ncbi:MAG TPA: hypothetical protein VMV93_14675 [Chloroflexota bacterium]|nr:hypothetical protein [Chloroflexota bacterium]
MDGSPISSVVAAPNPWAWRLAPARLRLLLEAGSAALGGSIGWSALLGAIALRILLSPLQHTWDSQTWWNALAQMGADPNPLTAIAHPYQSMRAMSDLAAGLGRELYYEYWAYPPGMLMLWWPLARLWTLAAGPMIPHFAIPDTFTAAPFPPLLSFLMKVPAIAADVITAGLLARLAGRTTARWYLFNPYVLLVCLWTFDPVMMPLLLGGLLAAERGRWTLSGMLLGLGGAVKFVPLLFLAPVCLWAMRRSRTRWRSAVFAAGGGAVAFAVVCLPWWNGVQFALAFQAGRAGGSMSWQSIWNALGWWQPLADFRTVHLSLSAGIGDLTLSGALLVTLWLTWLRQLDLWDMSLALMLAYLAGSKLVNEVYPLPALALAAICLARGASPARQRLVLALWVTPLVFALINVPFWGFVVSPAEALGLVSANGAWTYYQGYAQTYQYLSPALAGIGVTFQGACVYGIVHLVRGRRTEAGTRLGPVLAHAV